MLWNGSAGSFIYHIHSIRQCGALNRGPWFFSFGWCVGGGACGGGGLVRRRKWDTQRERLAVTERLSRLSQMQSEQSWCTEWIYYQTLPELWPHLLHWTEGAAVSRSSWEGEERMRQGCGQLCVCECVGGGIPLPSSPPCSPLLFCGMIW